MAKTSSSAVFRSTAAQERRFTDRGAGVRQTIQTGANHTITARGDIVDCTVWSVPDMPADEGARQAESMLGCLNDVVLTASSSFRGLTLNLVDGPPVFGPRTRHAIEGMIASAERSEMRMAFVVGESAIQHLQFRSLSNGREHVLCTRSDNDAHAFLRLAKKVRSSSA